MAELLWNSRYEESDSRNQWLSISPNTNEYMETMEEAEDENEEPDKTGCIKRFGTSSGE
jgi:hypothetical protein